MLCACKKGDLCPDCVDHPASEANSQCSAGLCTWTRAFDGNFNISCPSGERANGQFKGKELGAKWEFIYCPYCGRKINETTGA